MYFNREDRVDDAAKTRKSQGDSSLSDAINNLENKFEEMRQDYVEMKQTYKEIPNRMLRAQRT